MTIPTVAPSGNNLLTVNHNFKTLQHAAVYGTDARYNAGLIRGYLGGRWGGFSVADQQKTLTDAATNYVVVLRADGVLSVSTSATNWNATGSYARVEKLTTVGGVVTVEEDHRAGPNGVIGALSSAAAGRHAIPIMAAAMAPSFTGGCAALAAIASAANQPDITTLNFDTTTQEYAQFSIPMPKSWNEGTITFAPIWSHAATTTNFGVVWDLQAIALSNDDAIAQAFGTAQTSTDTGGTTNDIYIGPESSAITIAGTPAAEDVVFFRLSRVTGNGSDTMAIDARLHGIVLYITTDADNDA